MNATELLNPKPTAADLRAGLAVTLAVTEAIREAGEIPSGTLYALLCAKMDITAYQSMIAMLKRTGLIIETGHMLRWSGPVLEAK